MAGGVAGTRPSPASTGPTTAPATSPADANAGRTTVVRRGDIQLAIDFKGVFEPVQPFEVRLRTRKYHDDFIVMHAVAPGSKVAKGDVLLELDSDKIDLAIAAAENELEIARTNLAKAEQDVRLAQQADTLAMSNAKQHLVNAQTSLKRWDDIDSGITMLMYDLYSKFIDFDIEMLSDRLDQLHKMYQSEDLTNQTADIVMKEATRELALYKILGKIDHNVTDRYAQFQAAIQREEMSEVIDQQTVGVAQLGATQTQGHALRDTTLVTARSAAAEATKNLDQLKRDREMFSIVSGIDGVVVYGNFEHKSWHPLEPHKLAAGEKVAADQILMTVYRPGDLRLAVECPEEQLSFLSPGVKVHVTPVAAPATDLEGVCGPLPVVGEPMGHQQIFNLNFELPSVDARFAPGYWADVNLDAGRRENVLMVPATAIWRDKVWIAKPVVGVKAGTEGSLLEEPRTVVIGASNGQQVEIKSGLVEGDVILTQAKRPLGNMQ
jgi:multidrug resistance efflux pump